MTFVLSASEVETLFSSKYTPESISTYSILRSSIFWLIPDTAYCFNCDKILVLLNADTYVPFLGFMLIVTVPNSGGSISSPPTTATDSVSG